MPKRSYPGRRTREQWRALPRKAREDLAKRAQCDLFGSFRHCRNKTMPARAHVLRRRTERLLRKALAPDEEETQDAAQRGVPLAPTRRCLSGSRYCDAAAMWLALITSPRVLSRS